MSVNSAAADVGLRRPVPPGSAAAALAVLSRAAAAESDRVFLWLPVCFGAGILTYFALDSEPSPWIGSACAAAAALLCAAVRRHPWPRRLAVALLAACLGLVLAQHRTAAVAAPRLERPIGPAPVTGVLARVEPAGTGWRLTLADVAVAGLDAAGTPARLRLSARGAPPPVGSIVRVRARLMPPPAPAIPGGFDFQRQAWFDGLGAVGYTLGAVEILDPGPDGRPAGAIAGTAGATVGAAVGTARQTIDGRIAAVLDGDRGALASALITGLRGRVSEDTLVAMRESGLAHLLAISGLHMSLVAGFVFFAIRAGLAAVPPVALRWQTRKLAAVVALVFALGYLLLSGATVPTQRAFVMLAIALAAILADRLEVSMRPIALAALAVMAVAPETVAGPSFQLSFAAVVALVAVYETLRRRAERRARARVLPVGRFLAYPAGLLLTSVVATVATLPFAVYHFNQAALYAVAANLVAVPATGLWVMPAGLVALLAMPFGLEAVPLELMARGIDVIVWAARETASWPGAVVAGLVPSGPAVAVVAVGGLWLCLWRSGLRLAGVPIIAMGVAAALWVEPPAVFLSGDGKLAGARDADGTLLMSSMRSGAFERAAWMRHAGAARAAAWPGTASGGVSAGGAMRCDVAGCLYRRNGRSVLFLLHEEAVAADCPGADLVVVRAPISSRLLARHCVGVTMIRHADLRREGAHTLTLGSAGIDVATVAGGRGRRPWATGTVTDRTAPEAETRDADEVDGAAGGTAAGQ